MDVSSLTEPQGSATSRLARRSVLILASLLILLLGAGYALTLWRSYEETVTAATNTSVNLATVLDEHAQRTIRVVEVTLEGVLKSLPADVRATFADSARTASLLAKVARTSAGKD